MENILKYLFPAKCLFCNKTGDIFCDTCLGECELLKDQFCIVCDKKSSEGFTHRYCFVKGVSPVRTICTFSYSGKVRDCIKFSKYGARQFLSLKKLCTEAAGICVESWGALKADICVPIPSSPKKLLSRGFNQANMIAEEVSKIMKIPLRKDILLRARDTSEQYTQTRVGRRENVKDCFCVKDVAAMRGKNALLVDDICTTGSTFLEAAKVLYEAGASEVQCFALSKCEKVLL